MRNKWINHLIKATRYTVSGFKYAICNEISFRMEVILMSVLIPSAFFVGSNVLEKALLITVCLIVIITELLNSAIEAVIDRIGTKYHILSKHAKDMGSASVFVSLILMAVIWGLVIYERVI